ncbi:class I SAM-dependent methyltransferase [Oligella urethralis]|uniref:class I SAM-dependent methyltransferase n=1 Tax=Oligella urethralis TaxID=90245 RepID=UPI002155475C|nr:class I SAM-dependent methyltransferase [Oligella urethralis]
MQNRNLHQISLDEWLSTPMGQLVADWIQAKADDLLANVFGYSALQLGLPDYDLMRKNRIRTKVILTQDDLNHRNPAPTDTEEESISTEDLPYQKELEAIYYQRKDIPPSDSANKNPEDANQLHLNYENESVDLVILPFTLDCYAQPHQLLREVERILLHEGRLLIFGFNPYSLWGLRNRFSRFPYLPVPNKQQISLQKTKDWLQLLSFEIDRGQLACYEPALMNSRWLSKFAFMNKAGNRWWPLAGAVFYVSAIKRHANPNLVGAVNFKKPKKALKPAIVATKNKF